jgi:hypothetical protein
MLCNTRPLNRRKPQVAFLCALFRQLNPVHLARQQCFRLWSPMLLLLRLWAACQACARAFCHQLLQRRSKQPLLAVLDPASLLLPRKLRPRLPRNQSLTLVRGDSRLLLWCPEPLLRKRLLAQRQRQVLHLLPSQLRLRLRSLRLQPLPLPSRLLCPKNRPLRRVSLH